MSLCHRVSGVNCHVYHKYHINKNNICHGYKCTCIIKSNTTNMFCKNKTSDVRCHI